MPFAAKDLTGKRFGRLLVTKRAPNAKGNIYWVCRCDCGNSTVSYGGDLTRGKSKSCGCLSRELSRARILHGEGSQRTPEYRTWQGMNDRCRNPNATRYDLYGGRGIKVCKRWRESFAAFLADVGRRPTIKHTLDRFPDKNGDYELGNVRWATAKQQAQNTNRNVMLTLRGETHCIAEWSRILAIPRRTIRWRLSRRLPISKVLKKAYAP